MFEIGKKKWISPNKPQNFVSLRRKLLTGILLVVAVVSLARGIYEVGLQTNQIKLELLSKGRMMKTIVAQLASQPLADHDEISLVNNMMSLLIDQDISYITITDASGAVRCKLGRDDGQSAVYSGDISNKRYRQGWVSIGISNRRIIDANNGILIEDSIIFGFTVAILAILISVIAHYLIQPIEKLRTVVGEFGQGNYSVGANVETNDEIGALSRHFNSMIEAIRQREEMLLENEGKFHLLADNSTDIISLCDMQGYYLYVSPSCYKITGYVPEELLGRNLFEFIHPEDRDNVHKIYEESIGINRYYAPIYRFVCKDGNIVWLETVYHVNMNADGQPEMQRSSRNVSERINASIALHESLEKYRVLFESLPVGVAFTDGKGRFAEINHKAMTLLGKSSKELNGKSLFSSDFKFIRLDGKPLPVQEFASFVAMRENQVAESQIAGIVTDDALKWVVLTAAPFHLPGYGAVITCSDITDRVLSDAALTREKERLRITLQSIGDAVIATDSQGVITLMNDSAAQFTGWAITDAMGKPLSQVFDVYNEETGGKIASPVDSLLKTGVTIGLANHTMLKSLDGTMRYIADCAAPILDSTRSILGVVLVFRDVSSQKRKEKELAFQNYHDVLTGLYNRAFFEEEMKRLDSGRQMPISIIMGDVNGLKLTNDVFGHAEGDILLQRIAALLTKCCRSDDIIARIGGDEFCILLPNTDNQSTCEICERIYGACADEENTLQNGALRLSISLGFATKENTRRKLPSILKAAEDSMYKCKLSESRNQHNSIITSIRATLYQKSHETEEHASRLMANARMVGMKAMLTVDQLSDLELLAMLHDIGKIAVEDSVLAKPGKLTEEEWESIKKHPETGYRIATASPELMSIANCILTHHERWDGKGYPQGLSGADIPLLSRIISIADAYDAMTQDRVYRKAIPTDAAIAELKRNAGTQFDPELVELFISCID